MMIRLLKHELYKLCRGRLFLAGAVITAAAICLMYLAKTGEESAAVDGRIYTGYEAVRINRSITEEYAGELTDEKVERIVEQYGLPHIVERDYYGFRDGNYLNGFVTGYLSDGYYYSWDDYKAASRVYPIAETELGKIREQTGREITLEYVKGQSAFLDALQMGMMLGSLLVIFTVSVVFAGERQCKMLPLLFTSEKGKDKDIAAKILAAFCLTLCIWGGIVCWDLLLCGLIYGFGGLNALSGLLFESLQAGDPVSMMPIGLFVAVELIFCLLGLLFCCAVSLYASACFASNFHAVCVSAALWGAPLVIRIFFGGIGWMIVAGTPIFLIMINNFRDLGRTGLWTVSVGFAVAVTCVCVAAAYNRYKRAEVL